MFFIIKSQVGIRTSKTVLFSNFKINVFGGVTPSLENSPTWYVRPAAVYWKATANTSSWLSDWFKVMYPSCGCTLYWLGSSFRALANSTYSFASKKPAELKSWFAREMSRTPGIALSKANGSSWLFALLGNPSMFVFDPGKIPIPGKFNESLRYAYRLSAPKSMNATIFLKFTVELRSFVTHTSTFVICTGEVISGIFSRYSS